MNLEKKMIYFIPFPLILFLQLMNMQLCRITKQRMELTFRLKKTVFILLIQVDNILMEQTDITRTIILGQPTKEQQDRFTRVLKGHISIALATFKINTKGSALDPLARKSLLDIGCDYDHGTGHGVGSFFKCS